MFERRRSRTKQNDRRSRRPRSRLFGLWSSPLERLEDRLALAATTALTLVAGELTITDVAAGGQHDTLTLKADSANSQYIISDPNFALSASGVPGAVVSGDEHTVTVPFTSVTGARIVVNTVGGNDSLTTDLSLGAFPKLIAYDSGTGIADKLRMLGSGSEIASYMPSAATTGSGNLSVDGQGHTFANLEGIDIAGMAVATLATPAGATNDNLTIANGKDFATGLTDALRVSGNTGTGLVPIQTAAFFNNGSVEINTTASDGNDTIALGSADNAHNNRNLTIATGVGRRDNITFGNASFAGNVAVTIGGNLTLTGPLVAGGSVNLASSGDDNQLNANASITAAADSVFRFDRMLLNASIDLGAGNLTLAPESTTDVNDVINIGDAADSTADTLSLSDVELDRITARAITIGDTSTGMIVISAAMQHAGDRDFDVVTGANISLGNGVSWITTAGNLTFTANDDALKTGNYQGIRLDGASLHTQGAGNITLIGRGSLNAPSVVPSGIVLKSGAQISTTGSGLAPHQGLISLNGIGGSTATYSGVMGVDIADASTKISSTGDGSIRLTGTGGTTISGISQSHFGVRISSGTVESMGNGTITIDGTGGQASSFNVGAFLTGNLISSGSGAILVTGQGGNGTTGGANYGVTIGPGEVISSGTAPITITGTGGSNGNNNVGILSSGNVTTLGSGTIVLTGQGGGIGAASSGSNYGVYQTGGNLTTAGSGSILVSGTGGGGLSGGGNRGVIINSDDAGIISTSTATGAITIVGIPGTGSTNIAIDFNLGSIVTQNLSTIQIIGDSMDLASNLTIDAGSSAVELQPRTPGTDINLGAADSEGVLGLTDTELDFIKAGTIRIGNATTGNLTISANITRNLDPANLELTAGGSDSQIRFSPGSLNTSGGNVSLTTATGGLSNITTNASSIDIIAGGLSIVTGGAGNGIGTPGTPLRILVSSLSTDTSSTGSHQFLAQTGNLTWNSSTAGSGNMALSNGRFNIGDGQTITSGSISLSPGIMLGGSGAATGNVSVSSFGAITPGEGVGKLTLGNVTFTPTSSYRFDLKGPTAGTEYDQLSVPGVIDLGGATLTGNLGFVPTQGQKFVIVSKESPGPILGTFAGLPEGNTVTLGGQRFTITYQGGTNSNDVVLTADVPLSLGVAVTPTATGFVANFTRQIDASALNLYDQGGVLGSADVTLVGASTGTVRGSLIVDEGLKKITFLKTGGTLVPDQYTVSLTSGTAAVRDLLGNLLDGNYDGVAGDNYVGNFAVSAPPVSSVVLSAPDFVRGYGQQVHLPSAGNGGIPLTLSRWQGVGAVSFTLNYDSDLLALSGASLGAGVTGNLSFNSSTPGAAIVSISGLNVSGTPEGPVTLLDLTASVPQNAPYALKHLLDIASLAISSNDAVPVALPTMDDDGIHVATYLGDANGSQTYNAPDATLVQRLIVGSNSGLSAYQLADPYLIVDLNGNGEVQSNDVTLIQRATVGLTTPEIPQLPGLPSVAPGGPDPLLSIPQNLTATVGDSIDVPVELLVTEATGIELAGIDLAIAYDSTLFELTGIDLGTLTVGFGLSVNASTPGLLRLSLAANSPSELDFGAAGTLVNLRFTIIAGGGTESAINLLADSGTGRTALYDDRGRALTLVPAPTNADDDSVDGRVGILPLSSSEHEAAVDDVFGALGCDE